MALKLVYHFVAFQVVAIAIGAVRDNAFVINCDDAWTKNAFVEAFARPPFRWG